MKSPLALLTSALALIVFNVSLTSQTAADVYAYHGANGERILTDKRIYDKRYRLVKTYKTRKKPQPAKKVALKKSITQKSSSTKTAQNTFQCGNKAFISKQKNAYKNIIRAYAARYGVEEALIYSVVMQESCFNEKALSRAGAIGLMQLMPATASYLKVKDPWNPEQNIHGGVKYLSRMLKRFKGNTKFALAAYNAGPGKVERYGGIPPYRETQHYVKKIMADYQKQKSQGL